MAYRPIVDRDRELRAFTAVLSSSPDEAASVLLIKDESGQGKSRLLERY